MPNDAKIHDIALQFISKGVTGGCSRWPSMALGELHPSLVGRLPLEDGELVLMSAFYSDESWYAFTTRRIVSQFEGARQALDPSHGIVDDFGNFKGFGPDLDELTASKPGVVPREIATITATGSGAVVRFEFETWNASLFPIWAARYWNVKHPFRDKLMTKAERESYKARNS